MIHICIKWFTVDCSSRQTFALPWMTFIGTYWTFLFNYNLGVPKTMILQVFYQKTRKETPLICKSSYIYTLFCQLIINKSKGEHIFKGKQVFNNFPAMKQTYTLEPTNHPWKNWKMIFQPSTSMRFHGTQPVIFREGNPTQPSGNSRPSPPPKHQVRWADWFQCLRTTPLRVG